MSELNKLNQKQKEAVVAAARNWPQNLTPTALLLRLDALAKAIVEASNV